MYFFDVKAADGIRKRTQSVFPGLDRRRGAEEGTLIDTQNLSAWQYPLLSTRERRRIIETLTAPQAIAQADELCIVRNGKLLYGGEIKGTVTDGRKDVLVMGAYVIVFPDKKTYNQKTNTWESLESHLNPSAGITSFTFQDGEIYGEEAEANTLYANTMWGNYFREGDAVKISGCTTHPENNKTAIIREIAGSRLRFSENCFELGGLTSYTETGANLNVERLVPDMDFLCVNENRLWGCKGDTIYASALGDPHNFNTFDGVSTDSFAVDTGTAGQFTGCVSYLGYPIFFKQNSIFKVYGYRPSNFQCMRSMTMGIREGCGHSVAIAGEVCFYVSRNGICAYSGGTPRLISDVLGDEDFTDGVGGGDGIRYYLSARDRAGTWQNLTYDTRYGTWHREDTGEVVGFALAEDFHYLRASGEHGLAGHILSDDGTAENALSWLAEWNDLYGGDLNRKRVHKIQFRARMPSGSTMTLAISFDGGTYEDVATFAGTGKAEQYVASPVKRCDRYRLRLSGTGDAEIYSIAEEYSVGSGR